jgi:hypothetical protein
MTDVPIIGQNTDEKQPADDTPDTPEIRVVHKAALLIMEADGTSYFADWRTPIDTFTEATTNDVLHMADDAVAHIRMQQQAAVMMQTQMQVAAQMKKAAEDKAILEHIQRTSKR